MNSSELKSQTQQAEENESILRALEKERSITHELRATIAGNDSKMSFIEKKNGELEAKLNTINELNARNDQEKIFLRERIGECQELVAKLTDSNRILTEKLHDSEIKSSVVESQAKELGDEIKNLKAQLRNSMDQREELNIKYLEIIQKKTELKGQLRVFERLFQEKDQANSELQNNIQKLQMQRDEIFVALEEKKFIISSCK